MRQSDKVSNASVKIMRSYDYCHFEITMGVDMPITVAQVNDMRKEAMRLADQAVEQYKIAREDEEQRMRAGKTLAQLEKEVDAIDEIPDSERTPDHLAILKCYADTRWRLSRTYDYDDDWESDDEDW